MSAKKGIYKYLFLLNNLIRFCGLYSHNGQVKSKTFSVISHRSELFIDLGHNEDRSAACSFPTATILV